jgi:hypothetical protein
MLRPFCKRAGVVVAAVAIAGAGARAAHAQNADAEALFAEADGLESAGKVAEACDAFEASNRIEPRAGTLIRLGACREAQGRLASAWSAFKDSLTRVKDPDKRRVAEQRIAAIEPRLSYVIVSVPDESRVDGLVIKRNGVVLDPGLWNRAAPVDGGTYVIEGSAPGHEPWRTTIEVDNAKDRAAVEVPRFKELRALAEPAVAATTVDAEARDDVYARGGGGRRRYALIAGAAGVSALVVGGVLGMQSRGLQDDADARCPDPMVPCGDAEAAQSLSDRASSRAMFADVAFGVGAIAVGGAAVLWLTAGRESHSSSSSLSIAPRHGGDGFVVDLRGRF